jgi:RNA polymerase subunit RPABC4/transcription elongation factor Spt4
MFCTKCGYAIATPAQFCGGCGTRVGDPAPVDTTSQVVESSPVVDRTADPISGATTAHSAQQTYQPRPDDKFCMDCGSVIVRRAEICPKCGCRQLPAPTEPRSLDVSVPKGAGNAAKLVIGNILWNGLGNILVGDARGWWYAIGNCFVFFISLFTYGIPCIIYCISCCAKGFEYLGRQAEPKIPSAQPVRGQILPFVREPEKVIANEELDRRFKEWQRKGK